ncbi:MAG: mechanosensitive ion channel domain-containing protein [bacterium]
MLNTHTYINKTFHFIKSVHVASILPNSLKIGFILLTAVLISKLTTFFTEKISSLIEKKTVIKNERIKLRINTIKNVTNNVLIFLITLMTIALLLGEIGINIAPIIAGAGIMGLAVGLGVQNIVKDLVNGVFILYEDQYGIGDTVNIGSYNGTVEDINIRTTIIRDGDGSVHIIPNGEIKQVTVKTKDWSNASISINIPVSEYKRVINLLNKEINLYSEKNQDILIEPMSEASIENIEYSDVNIKITAKTKPVSQSKIQDDLKELLLNVLQGNS